MIEAAAWTLNARYDSVFTANITLANKSDRTFTGQVRYANITDGGYTNTSAINLTMDAEDSSAVQTMALRGSAGFTTVSVKNGTLRYSAPAASEMLSVSGGKLILTNASVGRQSRFRLRGILRRASRRHNRRGRVLQKLHR